MKTHREFARLLIGIGCALAIAVPSAAHARRRHRHHASLHSHRGLRDADHDGLTNGEEQRLGTNPFRWDTDGDGLSDGAEVHQLGTDPLRQDTDGDHISDAAEIRLTLTDPLNPDSDGDQLSDGDELRMGTDPNNPDSDGDGIYDGEEVGVTHTDPLNPDSDGDGVADGDELSRGTDPNSPDGRVDPPSVPDPDGHVQQHDDGSTDTPDPSTRVDLKAYVADRTGQRAKASYERKPGQSEFKVEVKHGQPGAVLLVAVNGTPVASLTLDHRGKGKVTFTTQPHEFDEQPLPAGFPVLHAGDIVSIGNLSAPLQPNSDD